MTAPATTMARNRMPMVAICIVFTTLSLATVVASQTAPRLGTRITEDPGPISREARPRLGGDVVNRSGTSDDGPVTRDDTGVVRDSGNGQGRFQAVGLQKTICESHADCMRPYSYCTKMSDSENYCAPLACSVQGTFGEGGCHEEEIELTVDIVSCFKETAIDRKLDYGGEYDENEQSVDDGVCFAEPCDSDKDCVPPYSVCSQIHGIELDDKFCVPSQCHENGDADCDGINTLCNPWNSAITGVLQNANDAVGQRSGGNPCTGGGMLPGECVCLG